MNDRNQDRERYKAALAQAEAPLSTVDNASKGPHWSVKRAADAKLTARAREIAMERGISIYRALDIAAEENPGKRPAISKQRIREIGAQLARPGITKREVLKLRQEMDLAGVPPAPPVPGMAPYKPRRAAPLSELPSDWTIHRVSDGPGEAYWIARGPDGQVSPGYAEQGKAISWAVEHNGEMPDEVA